MKFKNTQTAIWILQVFNIVWCSFNFHVVLTLNCQVILVLIYCEASSCLFSISSCLCKCLYIGCSDLIDSSLKLKSFNKTIIRNTADSPSKHHRTLSDIITSPGDNVEKFVCSCFPPSLYFLWFHPSLSESRASPQGQYLIYKYEQEILEQSHL